jgi:RNA polymerase sigma-70 factor (ECF subfamily)
MKAFYAWFFRIAENRIRDLVDYYGAKKRRGEAPRPLTHTTPAAAAVRSEQLIRVRTALGRLSDDYRRVIQLRRLEEREVAEVAALMERSENAVRILYCRALKALREELDTEI